MCVRFVAGLVEGNQHTVNGGGSANEAACWPNPAHHEGMHTHDGAGTLSQSQTGQSIGVANALVPQSTKLTDREGVLPSRRCRGEALMSRETPPLRVFTARAWQIVDGAPDRVAHAAHPGSRTTLCGLRVDGLAEFPDYVYTDLRDSLRCEQCDSAK